RADIGRTSAQPSSTHTDRFIRFLLARKTPSRQNRRRRGGMRLAFLRAPPVFSGAAHQTPNGWSPIQWAVRPAGDGGQRLIPAIVRIRIGDGGGRAYRARLLRGGVGEYSARRTTAVIGCYG